MLTIAIIEDEVAIRKEITWLLERAPDVKIVGYSTNVKDAIKLIDLQKPDIILMDIQLIDGTAFDILNGLKDIPENIIFITAYNQFAIKAIKFGALDYLLKPVDADELSDALERYRKKRDKNRYWNERLAIAQQSIIEENLPQNIVLHTISQTHIILVKDIIYCKGDGPYTFFYLENGKNLLVSKPLKHYQEILGSPFFLRTHQSYLVNKNYINKISKSEYLVLKNDEEIPVSSRRRNYVLNALSAP
ncbi:LytTR family DNA-binding domain-containing protein [Pedobacter sp. Leaf194]|uniref:LytR/AlgR family response regulator transcription factor n=1 Tax=Pedobacter sp. Leaf194 TaxID=1736297 RepID=UPI00070271AA|nr:LytTR family DNA-binding domain-containing protein [Pedobacter sp. Leaf194]KQS36736.1 two-component system response regulator [Pedobacter sp. Leaf194]